MMFLARRGIGSLVLLLGLAFYVYQALPVTASPPRQGPPERPSVIRGAALWTENCAPCHGVSGLGDGPTAEALEHPPANFADPVLARERTPADMFDVVANGRIERLMPPWKNTLSEQEMWDVVAYAQNLTWSPEGLEAGAAVYAEACAECHGEIGQAAEIDLTNPGTLANLNQQTLFDALQAAQDDHESLVDMSETDLWQSLDFVRTLSVEMPVLDGEVHGTVRNGTTGDAMPDVPLTLYAVSATGETMQSYRTTSDDAGRFTFTNLNTEHTISYGLEGVYLDVAYFSPQPIVFIPDEPAMEQELIVFETTADPFVVSQQRLHRIIAFGPDDVSLVDVHVFTAEGDRAFVGQPGADGLPETVQIALPSNATNIGFQDDAARRVGDRYISWVPLPPGQETVVSVRYSVPLAGDELRLETPLLYNVPVVNVLAADQGQTISSPDLESQGTQNFQGNSYQIFNGTNLSPGQPFVMELTALDQLVFAPEPGGTGNPGRVAPGEGGPDQSVLLWSILGLGAVVIAFSLFYSAQNPSTTHTPDALLAEEKDHLLLTLAELETLHQAGEVEDAVYQRLRADSRAKLRQVLVQLGEGAL